MGVKKLTEWSVPPPQVESDSVQEIRSSPYISATKGNKAKAFNHILPAKITLGEPRIF